MLSFKGYLKEARRNPEMNPKVSVNQRIYDHLSNARDIRGTNIPNSFASFTQIEKLGINPNSRYDTPIGIYAYPSFYVEDKIGANKPTSVLPFAGDQPYVNLFSVKGNIVDVSKMTERELSYYYQELSKLVARVSRIREGSSEWKELVDGLETTIFDMAPKEAKFNTTGGRFWWVTKELSTMLTNDWKAKSEPVSWNRLFREIGIDGCIDSEGVGIIHTSEPVQAVFFTNRGFYNVEQHENKTNYTDTEMEKRREKGRKIRDLKKYYRSMDEKEITSEIIKAPSIIQYLKYPTKKMQEIVVSKNPSNIQYIKNPTEEVQLAAIDSNAFAIENIKNPSEKLQLIAVSKKPEAIQFIASPSEKVQLAAVQENGLLIIYIDNPSEEVQLAAVRNQWGAIAEIKNPTEKVQLAAVQSNIKAIRFIDNPTEKVRQLAAELAGS